MPESGGGPVRRPDTCQATGATGVAQDMQGSHGWILQDLCSCCCRCCCCRYPFDDTSHVVYQKVVRVDAAHPARLADAGQDGVVVCAGKALAAA